MQASELKKDAFKEPLSEANLSPHRLLKVVSHYGLVESSSLFFDTYYLMFSEKLKMMSAFFYPCFLYRKINDVLTSITELATCDSISTDSSEYHTNEEFHTKQFIPHKTAKHPFCFLGTLLEFEENKTGLSVSQDIQIKNSNLLSLTSVDHEGFRSVRGQLLYIAQTTVVGI